jgi:hypothetical protein
MLHLSKLPSIFRIIVKDEEMGGACSTYGKGGGNGMHIGFWWESQNKRYR